jgi:hypothetical protein
VLTRDEYQAWMDSWGDDHVISFYGPWADESAEMSREDFEAGI